MRVLMLGGGVFLGRALARAFQARGWETSCLVRGGSLPGPVAGVEVVRGDRQRPEDLRTLATRDWDAVVDTCAYRPADLEAPLDILGERCGCWLLVSSVSVYAPPFPERPTEEAPLHGPVDPAAPLAEHYGALKAMCEDMVAEELGERALILRPGLIVGPEDPSERFAWWVRELDACGRQGRDPIWPDARAQPFQWVDVRDLAEFAARLLEEGAAGAVHVAGPMPPPSLSDILARLAALLAPGRVPRPRAEEEWRAAGLRPWADLPLWLPASQYPPFNLDTGAALGAGLSLRPLEETAADTLAWLRRHVPQGRGPGLEELAARLGA